MKPILGCIVCVRPGTYSVQERCAAMITKLHSDLIVDLTVFPGDGCAPFAIRLVKNKDEMYRESSNKEIFWHWPVAE